MALKAGRSLRGAIKLIDALLFLVLHANPPRVTTPTRRVLIVRLDAIGDFLLWLDAAKALRALYPRERFNVTLLANGAWAQLARDQEIFDEVLALDRAAYVADRGYRWNLWRAVRTARYETAISPVYSREIDFGDLIVRLSAASERIGYEGDFSNSARWQKTLGDRWYTRLIAASPEEEMELLRNAHFVRALGAKDFRAAVATLKQGKDRNPVEQLNGKYFVVVPGAGAASKRWPVARFAEIADRLHAATGWTAVVCGGSGEAGLGQQLCRAAKGTAVDLTGRTSLGSLAAVIGASRMVVSNDTGMTHMAAAKDVPSVNVLGGGHFGRFLPYRVEGGNPQKLPCPVYKPMPCFGCNWYCIYRVGRDEPFPCIDQVSVDDVWRAIVPLLPAPAGGLPP